MTLPSAEQQEAFCTWHLNCAICACQCGPAVHMYPFKACSPMISSQLRLTRLDTELMALPNAKEVSCNAHLKCAICACQCGLAVHIYPFRACTIP